MVQNIDRFLSHYSVYDCEALVVVETVSRALLIYLIGCKWLWDVTYHATFTSLLIQTCDKPYRSASSMCRTTDVISSMYEHPLLLKAMIRLTLCLAALIIHPEDAHLRRLVEMLLSGGMVKYLICVIKGMRRNCGYFQRILSPLMMTSWPT